MKIVLICLLAAVLPFAQVGTTEEDPAFCGVRMCLPEFVQVDNLCSFMNIILTHMLGEELTIGKRD